MTSSCVGEDDAQVTKAERLRAWPAEGRQVEAGDSMGTQEQAVLQCCCPWSGAESAEGCTEVGRGFGGPCFSCEDGYFVLWGWGGTYESVDYGKVGTRADTKHSRKLGDHRASGSPRGTPRGREKGGFEGKGKLAWKRPWVLLKRKEGRVWAET